MKRLYRMQLLLVLSDGRWHDAAELAHPAVTETDVHTWIRVLRAAGHVIEDEEDGGRTRYRLVSPPGPSDAIGGAARGS